MKQHPSQIEIRMAVPRDAPLIASVLLESFLEYKSLYTEAGFSATTPTIEQIEHRMREGPMWVAVCDGVIVGTGSAVQKADALYIRGMAVLPAARGSGIGERLLSEIERLAVARGYKQLLLSTTPFLSSAIQLYENFGFRRSDAGPHDLFGTPLFTMVKTLDVP